MGGQGFGGRHLVADDLGRDASLDEFAPMAAVAFEVDDAENRGAAQP
jgi:hypothetical protein